MRLNGMHLVEIRSGTCENLISKVQIPLISHVFCDESTGNCRNTAGKCDDMAGPAGPFSARPRVLAS